MSDGDMSRDGDRQTDQHQYDKYEYIDFGLDFHRRILQYEKMGEKQLPVI
jgi:hypothetical protein